MDSLTRRHRRCIVRGVVSVLLAVMMTTVLPMLGQSSGPVPVASIAHADETDLAAVTAKLNSLREQLRAETDPAKKEELQEEISTLVESQLARGITLPGVTVNEKECSAINIFCNAKKKITDASKGAFKAAAESIWQGFGRMIQLSMTWFIKIPTPKYQDYSIVQKIQAATIGLQFFGLVLSLIVIGFRLTMARRQAAVTEAEESVKSMAKSVFGAWTFGAVLLSLTVASDELSKWMLDQATNGRQAGDMLANLMVISMTGALGAGLIFVIGIIGILGALLQAVLLVARQAMLAVVVSLVPVIGAFGGTTTGKQAFQKAMMWTVALLLWKPVAAAVYWVAFWMAGSDSSDPHQVLMGMILLSLSALVLPILMKLVSGGAEMSGGSGAAAAGAVMGAVAAGGAMVATGGASAGAGAGAAGAGGGGASTASIAGQQGGGLNGGTGMNGSGGGGDGSPRSGDSGRPNGSTSLIPPADAQDGGTGLGTAGKQLAFSGASSSGDSSVESFFEHEPNETAGMGDDYR